MSKTPPSDIAADRPPRAAREDRLKVALKANMARRKAQARARKAGESPADSPFEGDGAGSDRSDG